MDQQRPNGATKAEFEARRERIAHKLHQAADTVRSQAERLPAGRRISEMAMSTASRMNTVADYAESHDLNAMLRDVENVVRRHPAQAITAAVFLGILVGRSLRRSDHSY